MKKLKSALALLLALGLFLSLFGCKIGGNDSYSILDNIDNQQFCIGFRPGDKAGEAVIAALAVLQDEGKLRELSVKWFGSDLSLLEGDGKALENLGEKPEKRNFIIGYDPGRLPFSGSVENGNPTGFDIDLATAVCQKLGWRTRFLAIDVSQAEVELTSGNVDCVMGGLAYDEDNSKIQMSPPYIKNTVVLATLAGSGVSLGGKTLMISDSGYYNSLLEKNSKLTDKPAFIIRVPDGADGCFKGLRDGSCDVIITDKAALDYYR
ncbi:MAG: transporter substrate-binding domain-containing protein [Oscillospiraceae bacterium]